MNKEDSKTLDRLIDEEGVGQLLFEIHRLCYHRSERTKRYKEAVTSRIWKEASEKIEKLGFSLGMIGGPGGAKWDGLEIDKVKS